MFFYGKSFTFLLYKLLDSVELCYMWVEYSKTRLRSDGVWNTPVIGVDDVV